MTVDFNKVVQKLNETLDEKYNSVQMKGALPEFESKELRNYFHLQDNGYSAYNICFANMIIYLYTMYTPEEQTEEQVIEETKKYFNIYLDSLATLKF